MPSVDGFRVARSGGKRSLALWRLNPSTSNYEVIVSILQKQILHFAIGCAAAGYLLPMSLQGVERDIQCDQSAAFLRCAWYINAQVPFEWVQPPQCK